MTHHDPVLTSRDSSGASRPARIVVTGGAGFIGSHVVDRLLGDGSNVLVVDDLSTGDANQVPDAAQLQQLDVAHPSFVELARSFEPDVIVHCAANSSIVRAEADPAGDARSNILGSIQVARAALETDARVVYVTTGGALYGHPRYLPCDEEHPDRAAQRVWPEQVGRRAVPRTLAGAGPRDGRPTPARTCTVHANASISRRA